MSILKNNEAKLRTIRLGDTLKIANTGEALTDRTGEVLLNGTEVKVDGICPSFITAASESGHVVHMPVDLIAEDPDGRPVAISAHPKIESVIAPV